MVKNSADQIACPECDGRGLILETHEPCECCLGFGMIPVPDKVRPFSNGGEDDIRFTAKNWQNRSIVEMVVLKGEK